MDEGSAAACTSLVIAPEISFRVMIPDEFNVPRHDVNIVCHQGVSTGGMLHTGSIIWDGSRFLASWLASGVDLGMPEAAAEVPSEGTLYSAHPLHLKHVLELGSGVSGLPSLVAAACGAARVIATDLPEECALLQRNVEYAVKAGVIPSVVDVMSLDWAAFPLL